MIDGARLAVPLATSRRSLSYVLVLVAATMWGTIGTSYRIMLDHIDTDPFTIVTIRACTATALLWIWVLWKDRPALRVRTADLPRLVVFGFVTITIFYPALIYAFEETSVAVGTVLLYLAPALVTIGAALFLDEPLNRRKLTALAATFLGCLLVVEANRPANLEGNAVGIGLGLVAAASYGAYSLMGKSLLARYRAPTVLAAHFLIGSSGLLVAKLVTSPSDWPDLRGALIIAAYSGIVVTLAPITLYTLGLRGLPSSEASILATLEPVVAVILAAIVLDESLSAGQVIGALLVFAGVALLATRGAGRGDEVAPVPVEAPAPGARARADRPNRAS